MTIPGFTCDTRAPNGVDITYSIGGAGPPLVLLHGFPQTHAMWAQIAPDLAATHTVICPDLRGYGDSGKPQDMAAYSFRAMARDVLALMDQLGHSRFAVAGHDRGGRVAHRLALDAPDAITRLAVLDIVPTHTLLDDLHAQVARAYYHWFFLAQPEPFPETMIAHDPDAYYESCLLGWGKSDLSQFDAAQLAAYRSAWRKPETIRGMCNDYRATLAVDFQDDADDLSQRVTCPTLVLYGADGAMAQHYDMAAAWSDKCTDVQTCSIPGGHFFPDTAARKTATALSAFFG